MNVNLNLSDKTFESFVERILSDICLGYITLEESNALSFDLKKRLSLYRNIITENKEVFKETDNDFINKINYLIN